MGIFGRILNIIRSEMGHRWSEREFTQSDPSSDRDAEHWSHRRTYRQQSRSEASPPKNPKLAEYYANLEIPYGSDFPTVHKAWKKQLSKYHPDLYSNDPEKQQVAHDLTQQLNRAYQELKKHLKPK